MALKITGGFLLVLALSVVVFVLYRNSGRSDIPLVYASTQVLNATWNHYKQTYIEPTSHRTLDLQRDSVTTSEGESYTMLRAVWLGDKATFDSSWNFTHNNLQHKNDALFSWLYGKRSEGGYGILTDQGGANSASDADSDIALALVFAYSRWQDPAYLSAARSIVSDIWDKEVLVVNGTPYLVANDIEKTSTQSFAIVNPSYFSPYAYKIFAQIDPAHPWNTLVDSSYSVLQKSITAPLGETKGVLPPDWLSVDKKTGALLATGQATLPTTYGYDAMRIPWRLGLDWQWNKDTRAKKTLAMMQTLEDSWQENKKLNAVYTHAGDASQTYEAVSMYGGSIGYFLLTNPQDVAEVYATKLAFLYDPDTNGWKQTLSYYDDNWAWFGIGLYNNLLPNFADGITFPVNSIIAS